MHMHNLHTAVVSPAEYNQLVGVCVHVFVYIIQWSASLSIMDTLGPAKCPDYQDLES